MRAPVCVGVCRSRVFAATQCRLSKVHVCLCWGLSRMPGLQVTAAAWLLAFVCASTVCRFSLEWCTDTFVHNTMYMCREKRSCCRISFQVRAVHTGEHVHLPLAEALGAPCDGCLPRCSALALALHRLNFLAAHVQWSLSRLLSCAPCCCRCRHSLTAAATALLPPWCPLQLLTPWSRVCSCSGCSCLTLTQKGLIL